ncbi:FecR domain-containing protein [Caulobacter segnis]|uniref:FecR family protein n=1 Tax=Caulobacter segnis TaxID=88688 RepID=UPI0028625C94|nr:FecR domain-containing protein [Caulobacter segnis]MDR6625607.1 transmembrane sensor [Caulobacter segnis]
MGRRIVHEDQAAQWFAKADRGPLAADDRKAFLEWLEAPGNAEAYQETADAWSSLAAAKGADGLIAMRAAALREAAGISRRRMIFSLVGAVTAAGGGGVAVMMASTAGATIRTGAGERLTAPLPDGSSVTLAPLSSVRVQYDAQRRRVRLVEGQAYFDMRSAPDRPFQVVVGDERAQGSGGRFQVTKQGDKAQILIEDGALDVVAAGQAAARRLTTGHMLSGQAGPKSVAAADLDALTAWRDGRLVFNDTPLPQVVAAFNRYSSDQLSLVPGARLNDIRISGSFRYDGAREFANALRAGFGVRVQQVDRTTWEIAE